MTGKPAEGGGRIPRVAGDLPEAGGRKPRRHRLPQKPGDLPELISATCYCEAGKPAEAEAECRKALAILQKLVDEEPRRPRLPRRSGDLPQESRRPAVADGQAGGGGGRMPHRRWRSERSWRTTTPPSRSAVSSSPWPSIDLGDVVRSLWPGGRGQGLLRTGDRPEGTAGPGGSDEPGNRY